MKTHLSDEDVEAYRNKTASPERLVAMNDHIFECAQCFQLLDSPDRIGQAYEALREFFEPRPSWPEHLDYEQLESFVNGTAGAETTRLVTSHMAECQECREDIRDLKAMKDQIDAEADIQPETAKRRFAVGWWHSHSYKWALAVVALLVVVAGIIWALTYKRQPQVAKQEQTPTPAVSTTLLVQDGGRQLRLSSGGELLGLDELPAKYVNALKDALRTGRLSLPTPPETTLGKVGTLLGPGDREHAFDVIFPASTTVEDTRPSFHWQRLAGATEYTLMIKDLVSGAEIESPSVSGTSWTAEAPLVRGHQYVWMVEAVVGSHRVRAPGTHKPFATFTVLDERREAEIVEARKRFGDSHLGMGLAYADAGLVREAEREFSDLVAANPGSSLAKNLLASVARVQTK